MFDMFNSSQNPFVAMMNMAENSDSAAETEETDQPGFAFPTMPAWNPEVNAENGMNMNPMMFMQQMFMMNMMIMQNMFMMPMQMMQFMMNMRNMNSDAQEDPQEEDGTSAPAGGFKLGSMNIPPEMLTKLMEMDMSPENLQKLQKVLDFVFSAVPDQKAE